MNDQAQRLRELVAQNPEVKQTPPEPDYRALWLGLKEELAQARLEWIRRYPDEPWVGPRSRALELMDQYEMRMQEPTS